MPRRSVVALLALVAVVVVACRDPDAGPARDRALLDGDDYVAIGDSYTAAPGSGQPDGNDGCARSASNYPHLVAEELDLDLRDVSCSGAPSSAVAERFRTVFGASVPAQIDALDEETDLVTIGIGANDEAIIGAVVGLCVQAALAPDAGDSPCADYDSTAGSKSLDNRLARMEQRLGAVLDLVGEHAPDAKVLVIGYPEIFPEPGETCDLLPLAPGDYAYARRVNLGLNRALSSAAEEAGVTYLDVFAETEGRHICSERPLMAGARAEHGRASPWHPYPEEQRLVAELIVDEVG